MTNVEDNESEIDMDYDSDMDLNTVVFEELDNHITVVEIESCIKKLKREKSHGEDCILNEYLIECKDMLLPLLHKVFNLILDTGYFPTRWTKAVIIPVFKKVILTI